MAYGAVVLVLACALAGAVVRLSAAAEPRHAQAQAQAMAPWQREERSRLLDAMRPPDESSHGRHVRRAENPSKRSRRPSKMDLGSEPQKMRVVTCGDFPLSGSCLWRAASILDVTMIPDRSVSGYARALEVASNCASRHQRELCNVPQAVRELEEYQLQVVNADNAPQVALELISLSSMAENEGCKDSLRNFQDCYDSTYDRLLRFKQIELCRRLEFHRHCMNKSKIVDRCPLDQVATLVKTDEKMRRILEQVLCEREAKAEPSTIPDLQESIARQSLLDFISIHQSSLRFALSILICKVDPDNCGV